MKIESQELRDAMWREVERRFEAQRKRAIALNQCVNRAYKALYAMEEAKKSHVEVIPTHSITEAFTRTTPRKVWGQCVTCGRACSPRCQECWQCRRISMRNTRNHRKPAVVIN